MRHSYQVKGEESTFRSGNLFVDLTRRRVTLSDTEIKLSPIEFSILELLATHAGKVLTHKQILREVWGSEGDIQYLRTYVRHLRKKLDNDSHVSYIATESGVGYRLQDAD
jgi:two-component system KDP operon response regulator KdpE